MVSQCFGLSSEIILKPIMNIRKKAYHILGIIVGLVLSFTLHAIIEVAYINHFLSRGVVLQPSAINKGCFLPPVLQIALPLAGIIFGYLLGHIWSNKSYRQSQNKK